MGRAFAVVAAICLLGFALLSWGAASVPAQDAPATPDPDLDSEATPMPIKVCFAEWPAGEATPEVANEGAFRDTVANTLLNSEQLFESEDGWTLHLNRILIERGGSSPVSCYPPMVLYVESGSLEIRLYVGDAFVVRGAVQGAANDEVYSGTPGEPAFITLQPGDSIALQDAFFSLHNPGWDEVVLVVSSLQPDDLPCPCYDVP